MMRATTLKYMPVFRLRRQEKQVLTTFNFGTNIIPYVEIIKELEQKPRNPSKKTVKRKTKPKPQKRFEDVWIPILCKINADHVFVDLPIHMKQSTGVNPEVLSFLRTVATKHEMRNFYLQKFWTIAEKVIPIISTFAIVSTEPNSIITQEQELRPIFKILGFRTSEKTFMQDMNQIKKVVRDTDFLIVDIEEHDANPEEEYVVGPMVTELKSFDKCPVIMLRNAVQNSVKNKELPHDQVVSAFDNSLVYTYPQLNADAFGDYAGIKKDKVPKGGGKVTPGFIFYDGLSNQYYGYRGVSDPPELSDFETIIVPAVMRSEVLKSMRNAPYGLLDDANIGYRMLRQIADGANGKIPGTFKRISMEHYLHSIKRLLEIDYRPD